MRIPRKKIKETLEYINDLETLKYIHFRDLNKTIDRTNYHICTKVDFTKIKLIVDDVFHTWNLIKQVKKVNYSYESKTGSHYMITEDGYIYRLSNHWGATASCEWTLEGNGELRMSVFEFGDYEIGCAHLSEFKIFRRNVDRNVDAILNPLWLEKIKSISPMKEYLESLIKNPEFKDLKNKDKRLIGESFGMMKSVLKQIN